MSEVDREDTALSDRNKLYILIGVAVTTVCCTGIFSMFGATAGVMLLARYNQEPVQREKPKAALHITKPGSAVRMDPVPARIPTSGPPLPDEVITTDQCGDVVEGNPLKEGECVTAEIHCDEMVIGHTEGGVDLYDSSFYEHKFCWPRLVNHDGGNERIYRLEMPTGEWRAWATLHTPCANLDLMAMRANTDTCPTINTQINQCEMKYERSRRSERIEMVSQTRNGNKAVWWIVVEGSGDEEGPFSLHVQCAPGLSGGM